MVGVEDWGGFRVVADYVASLIFSEYNQALF